MHDNSEYLEKILKEHPEIDFIQLQLNYLDWEDNGVEARKCYELSKKYEKPVVVMEPVKGGSLANVPPKAEELMKEYNSEASPASWALRFVAELDNVMMVLSGVSNQEQLDDNLETFNNLKPINNEEREIINKVTDIIHSAIAIPCTSCDYCINSCPENIYISKYFELYNTEKQTEWKGFSQQLNYYLSYITRDEYGRASDCIECGACVEQCPQHLDIPKYMKEVSEEFDPAADATNEIFS